MRLIGPSCRLVRTLQHSPFGNSALRTLTRRSMTSSERGQNAVRLLPSYLADARSVAKYHPTENPDGALQLGVAESLMLEDWLVPRLNDDDDMLPASAIYYQPTQGRPDVAQSVARYMEDLLNLKAGRIDPSRLILGSGCNAVLENLVFCLAEAGDSVLIPTPYYAAFEFDLVARAGLRVQAVAANSSEFTEKAYYPTAAALDAAYAECEASGSRPQILLLSHPNNPLGICYPPHVIQECIDWCRQRQVHLISDEIYAGSIFRPQEANFQSALALDDNLGPYVHWVYALSKDFCLSGLRVGVAYTENEDILLPFQKLNDLCQISSTTQLWTQRTLDLPYKKSNSDGTASTWVQAFRNANHQRLQARAAAVAEILDAYRIPYFKPTAGLFCWMNMSQFLNDRIGDPAEQERQLYLELVRNYGLLLTPGWSMRHEQPGYFRLVFTAATESEFQIALGRLERFAKEKSSS